MPSEAVGIQSSQTHCWPEIQGGKSSRWDYTSLCSGSDTRTGWAMAVQVQKASMTEQELPGSWCYRARPTKHSFLRLLTELWLRQVLDFIGTIGRFNTCPGPLVEVLKRTMQQGIWDHSPRGWCLPLSERWLSGRESRCWLFLKTGLRDGSYISAAGALPAVAWPPLLMAFWRQCLSWGHARPACLHPDGGELWLQKFKIFLPYQISSIKS